MSAYNNGRSILNRTEPPDVNIAADPLPHPSKDTRKKPNPNSKPSSPLEPWRDYTGKGKGKA